MRLFSILGKKETPITIALVFPLSAIISFGIIGSEISAQNFLQLLAAIALFIIIYHRFLLEKISKINKTLAFGIEFTPAVFFIYLLVLSTGGITSQFLILTHIISLGIVFLLGLTAALIYSGTTITLLTAHIVIDPNGQLLWNDNPFIVLLYLVAFLAIIPFAYLLARYHYFREEWVEALSNQVTTSKLQEENLLANINDAVIVVDKDLKIVLANTAAQSLTLYKDVDLFGKSIYSAFSLKDNGGNIIDQQKLPLQRLIDSKASITERGLHLSKKDSTYVEVDLKVSPVIDSSQNAVGLMLIAKDVSKLTESERLTDSLTELSFRRFLQLSAVIKKNLANLPDLTWGKEQKQKDSLNIVIEKNEELMRFTNDFLTVLKIDSGELSGLVTLIDLYPIVSKTLTDAVKISIKDANVNFIPHDLTPDILPVKEQVFPAFKRELPVFADPIWLSETLTKILYVSVELSNNNQVDVNLEEVLGDAKISFSFKVSDFPGHLEKDLFKKYYGKLSDYKDLVNTSGFEIYIASELLERIGGNLSVERDQGTNKMSFLAKIPRAPIKKKSG